MRSCARIPRIITSPKSKKTSRFAMHSDLTLLLLSLPACRMSRSATFSHPMRMHIARIKIVSFEATPHVLAIFGIFASLQPQDCLSLNWRVSSLSTVLDAEWHSVFKVEGLWNAYELVLRVRQASLFFSFSLFRFLRLLSHSTENREATRRRD